MKISNSTQNYINQSYTNRTDSPAGAPPKLGKTGDKALGDSINLSTTTMDLQKISTSMDTEPIDRKKLVADLKQQVQANQYTINSEQIAEKMIGSFMDELG
ncbi:MAG: flagellar biosynthesis anti-sigma factor FlgM [Desulfobacteraceae bacterium]|nr:flagellar biosynthesis anti-sigma factor FlgM [Desulfobacteraceae bacterium]